MYKLITITNDPSDTGLYNAYATENGYYLCKNGLFEALRNDLGLDIPECARKYYIEVYLRPGKDKHAVKIYESSPNNFYPQIQIDRSFYNAYYFDDIINCLLVKYGKSSMKVYVRVLYEE